jgi:CheY-like chemotaxis protein
VEIADDGARGLQKALVWRPEVAVVDIALPGLDGYHLARQMRAALGGSILLVALTGYCQEQDRGGPWRRGSTCSWPSPPTSPICPVCCGGPR